MAINKGLLLTTNKDNSYEVEKLKTIDSAMGIVYKLAYQYKQYNKMSSIDELVNAGIIALYNAYDKFDKNLGIKFSTYVYDIVKGEIRKCANESSNRGFMSETQVKKLYKIKEIENRVYQDIDGVVTSELIAEYSNGLFTKEEVEELRSFNIVELDASIDSDNDSSPTFADTIADEDSFIESYNDEERKEKLCQKIEEALALLDNEEKRVVTLYYIQEKNYTEIARILNTNANRVRSTINRAMNKIRDSNLTSIEEDERYKDN